MAEHRWRRGKQRGREYLDYRSREIGAYAQSFVKRPRADQVRVVIFAQGRTGSTVLESLLASTGHFELNGELLNTDAGEALWPGRFIRGLSRRQGNFICHVKVYQLARDRKRPADPAAFLRSLNAEGWRIIYLRRENKIRHVLSNIVATARGRYHKQDDKPETITLTVDRDDLIRAVRERIAFEEQERQALGNLPYHAVIYETDLEDAARQQGTVNGILDHLGLEQRAVNTPQRKVNTARPAELIANYDEVRRCVQEHGWGRFLE